MTNLIVLVLGIALRRSGRLPDGARRTLNAFIIDVALPALCSAGRASRGVRPGTVLAMEHGPNPRPMSLLTAAASSRLLRGV